MRAAPVVGAAVLCAALVGCSAPADLDGELAAAAPPAPAAVAPPAGEGSRGADAAADGGASVSGDVRADLGPVPVVVDTDLGADDLVALAFLMRHPDVDVRAVTIASTGLVGCDPGVEVLGGLLAVLDEPPVPVACGRADAGPEARRFPAEWRAAAARGSGLAPRANVVSVTAQTAPDLMGRLAREEPGLVVLALGPLTNVADLALTHPDDYRRVAAVRVMAGSVAGPPVDGVAEWNAAADPAALTAVLSGPAPVVVVPEDAVPQGTPEALRTPALQPVVAGAGVPAWWDVATAASLVAPPGAAEVQAARWVLDPATPGRLLARGSGPVRVVRSLDAGALAREYSRALSLR